MKKNKSVGLSKNMLFLLNMVIETDHKLSIFILSALDNLGKNGVAKMSMGRAISKFGDKQKLIDALEALKHYEVGQYSILNDQIIISFNCKFVEHK